MNSVKEKYLKIPLPYAELVDISLVSELEKESVFVSEHLVNLTVDLDQASVFCQISDLSKKELVAHKVSLFLDAMIKNYRTAEIKEIARFLRTGDDNFEGDVFDKLIERKWIYQVGQGHISINGPVLKLFRLIDDFISTLYRKNFKSEDIAFPSLIPSKKLAVCGYFDSHPQNVTMTTHIKNDFEKLEEFRINQGQTGNFDTLDSEFLIKPHTCLNPAACLPCYEIFSNKVVNKNSLSWLGRVYRFESSNVYGLERLWEFNVRELVFIGSERYVFSQQKIAIGLILELCKYLNISCTIETASDPFFATIAATKKFWQHSMESKYEIKLPVGINSDVPKKVAAGSINFHSDFFGQRFSISLGSNKLAHTGCVGLGIERFILACFSQNGFEEKKWPKEVYKKVFN